MKKLCLNFFKLNGWEITDEDCEVYTRIVGYYRALTRLNKGKKSDYNDRITFDVTN